MEGGFRYERYTKGGGVSKKKRNKKYRPRTVKMPMVLGNQWVFAAPLKLLHDIRHGYVEEYRGKILLPSVDRSEAFLADETLDLFAEFMKRAANHFGQELDTTCVNRLASRLRVDMPVTEDLMDEVDAAFESGQSICGMLTGDQALNILSQCEGG